MWTAQQGHAEVAKLLLERGADSSMRDKVGVGSKGEFDANCMA